tara:strand:- start:855 stop:1190 length:336 start_codon:yes stop_codon:yes gene_type:complete
MCDNESFEFIFQSSNKTATVEVGQSESVSLTEILQAVQNILISGGYDYVDEVRAVSYGPSKNTIYTSNPEDSQWIESDNGLERRMATETIMNAEAQAERMSGSWARENESF